jgi:hypothetical protein
MFAGYIKKILAHALGSLLYTHTVEPPVEIEHFIHLIIF